MKLIILFVATVAITIGFLAVGTNTLFILTTPCDAANDTCGEGLADFEGIVFLLWLGVPLYCFFFVYWLELKAKKHQRQEALINEKLKPVHAHYSGEDVS